MRPSEWIQAGFATALAIAAWFSPLSTRRRVAVALFAAFAVGAILLAHFARHLIGPQPASILRDWLPVALTLVPYWQTGQFFRGPNEKVQERLAEIDQRIGITPPIGRSFSRTLRLTMEWAYMLCYPLVPLGLATLYFAGMRGFSNTFWFFVLVPTYLCYAITPLVPALPPRSLGMVFDSPRPTKSRVFNLWILKWGSIHAISFPSAHVAAALAVSLVLMQRLPIAGIVFLVIAVWISLAAVVGGYHYAIDVLLGAVVTLAVFAAWLAHLIPSTLITAPAMTLAAPL